MTQSHSVECFTCFWLFVFGASHIMLCNPACPTPQERRRWTDEEVRRLMDLQARGPYTHFAFAHCGARSLYVFSECSCPEACRGLCWVVCSSVRPVCATPCACGCGCKQPMAYKIACMARGKAKGTARGVAAGVIYVQLPIDCHCLEGGTPPSAACSFCGASRTPPSCPCPYFPPACILIPFHHVPALRRTSAGSTRLRRS